MVIIRLVVVEELSFNLYLIILPSKTCFVVLGLEHDWLFELDPPECECGTKVFHVVNDIANIFVKRNSVGLGLIN